MNFSFHNLLRSIPIYINSAQEKFVGVMIGGGSLSSSSEVSSIVGSTTGLSVADGTPNAVRLDTLISAEAGDQIQIYSPVDCYLGWGNNEAEAEANSVIPVDATTGNGSIFPAGVETKTVPSELTGEIWISLNGDTTNLPNSGTGISSISLLA